MKSQTTSTRKSRAIGTITGAPIVTRTTEAHSDAGAGPTDSRKLLKFLDEVEAVAKPAQAQSPGPWVFREVVGERKRAYLYSQARSASTACIALVYWNANQSGPYLSHISPDRALAWAEATRVLVKALEAASASRDRVIAMNELLDSEATPMAPLTNPYREALQEAAKLMAGGRG